ncbi:MAG: hypothetical protein E7477_09295 [Ruminococcaceae bacterium]|nr:hypothetical protein [Oscillospiraceae bacterium]
MKSTFDLGLMKLIAVLVVTVFMVSCISVISEEISDLFDQDDRSFSFSFEEDMSDKYFLINSLLVNTDLQTVTVNEKEIKFSTIEYRMIEKICKKIAEDMDISSDSQINLQGGLNK